MLSGKKEVYVATIFLIKVCFNLSDLCNYAKEWSWITHSKFLLLGQQY
jgi:hypothetical protein